MIYSGFWRRFVAVLLDALFIWIICLITFIPYFIPPLALIVAAYYHVVFEVSPLRATPGKSLMKIAVVKSNGDKLTIKDSIIRFVVSFLSSVLLCIGYLIALFTEKKQTFHDFVADTIVIDEVFAESNFWQIFVTQSKIIFNSGSSSTSSYERPLNAAQSLEELYALHQKGILTDEEYKVKKEEYLKRL